MKSDRFRTMRSHFTPLTLPPGSQRYERGSTPGHHHPAVRRMDLSVRVRAPHRRSPRPPHPPRQHPRDEWRELQAQPEPQASNPDGELNRPPNPRLTPWAHRSLPRAPPHRPVEGTPRRTRGPPMDFYEATEVKVRCTLCLEHVLSPLVCQIGGASCRVGTLLAWVARPCGCPTFYPGGFRRRCAGSVPQSRLLRAQRSGGGTLPTGRRLSALSTVGHSPPGPAPAASGRTGTVRSQDQASLAPVGTRPVSQNRQRAMSSLRASATTITRRIRPRPPAVRSSNHLLSALSG